jgi:hypothetical protein
MKSGPKAGFLERFCFCVICADNLDLQTHKSVLCFCNADRKVQIQIK